MYCTLSYTCSYICSFAFVSAEGDTLCSPYGLHECSSMLPSKIEEYTVPDESAANEGAETYRVHSCTDRIIIL